MAVTARPSKSGRWSDPALRVLRERYLARRNGEVEETPEEMCWRVALTVARAEERFGRSAAGVGEVAAAFYDTMVQALHTSVRNGLLVAVVVALTAFVAGPARLAVATRASWARAVRWLGGNADRTGWRIFSAGVWVSKSKRVLRIVLAAVLFSAAFRWPHPTTQVLFWLSVAGLLGLVGIDFYGRAPVPPAGRGTVRRPLGDAKPVVP